MMRSLCAELARSLTQIKPCTAAPGLTQVNPSMARSPTVILTNAVAIASD